MKKQAFAWERHSGRMDDCGAGRKAERLQRRDRGSGVWSFYQASRGRKQGLLHPGKRRNGPVQLLDGHDQKQHQCRRLERI